MSIIWSLFYSSRISDIRYINLLERMIGKEYSCIDSFSSSIYMVRLCKQEFKLFFVYLLSFCLFLFALVHQWKVVTIEKEKQEERKKEIGRDERRRKINSFLLIINKEFLITSLSIREAKENTECPIKYAKRVKIAIFSFCRN